MCVGVTDGRAKAGEEIEEVGEAGRKCRPPLASYPRQRQKEM